MLETDQSQQCAAHYVIIFAPAGLAQHTLDMQKAHVQIMQRELSHEKDNMEGIRTACQKYAVFLCTWIFSSQGKDALDRSKVCGSDVALWKEAQIAQQWLKISFKWKILSTTASPSMHEATSSDQFNQTSTCRQHVRTGLLRFKKAKKHCMSIVQT